MDIESIKSILGWIFVFLILSPILFFIYDKIKNIISAFLADTDKDAKFLNTLISQQQTVFISKEEHAEYSYIFLPERQWVEVRCVIMGIVVERMHSIISDGKIIGHGVTKDRALISLIENTQRVKDKYNLSIDALEITHMDKSLSEYIICAEPFVLRSRSNLS